jgi:hypothetical protein
VNLIAAQPLQLVGIERFTESLLSDQQPIGELLLAFLQSSTSRARRTVSSSNAFSAMSSCVSSNVAWIASVVSPAGYYAWRARSSSARSSANAELADDPIVASIALPLLMAGIPSGAAASVRFAKSQLP